MILLAFGLRFSTYVVVYFLLSTLSADIVYGRLRGVSGMEGVTRTEAAIVKTTDDNMYSLEIHRGKNAREHCIKTTKKRHKFNRYDYVELFYRDSRLDSFCSLYPEYKLIDSVSYYCHAVGPGVNVHVFHLDYMLWMDPECVTVWYSLDPAPGVTESASCFRTKAYQMQGDCLSLNGWSYTRVSKALRHSVWLDALENKPLGVKKWITKN